VYTLTALSGSPRKGGNTDLLLKEALGGARHNGAQVSKIVLNDLNIRPCQECGRCLKTGMCYIKDDMAVVYKALDESQAILVASPIFFGNVTAQTKIIIDRMQCYWVQKYVLKRKKVSVKKYGGFICCGAFKKEVYFKCARAVIDIFFKVQNIDFTEELFVGGVDESGDVLTPKDMLEKAYELGKRLAKN